MVLVSSAHQGRRDIMTMGWHMIMMDEPSLVGCFIWDQNYSRELVQRSKECVINVPENHLVEAVVGIGNSHGSDVDKFEEFGLTAAKAAKVDAPLIAECYANFECKLIDDEPHPAVQRVRVRGREGPRGDVAALPENGPLPRRRRVHGVRAERQLPEVLQA